MNNRKRVINSQVFIETLSYILFAGLLIYLASSGKYLRYVTPRMVPYLYFTSIVLVVWTIFSLFRLFQSQNRSRFIHCYILVIPAVIILMPYNAVGSSGLSAKLNIGNETNKSNLFSKNLGTNQLQTNNTENSVSVEGFKLSGFDSKNKKIVVKDEEYSRWVYLINANPQQFVGYKIRIKGFVFKDAEKLAKNEFFTARLLMTCCVADLRPYGIVSEYDEVSQLTKDSWIIEEGMIKLGNVKGANVPIIQVTKVNKASKPSQEYVFSDFEELPK